MTKSRVGVDRRTQALAALGAFYLRQGFPDQAVKLLAAADRLLADDPGALGDTALGEAVARNLAYALLLTSEASEAGGSGGAARALALLTSGRIAPENAAEAAALEHLMRRARRAATAKNRGDAA